MTSGRDLFAPKLGLTLPLCGFHFIFFFLYVTDPKKVAGLFGFWPQQALTQPWGFLTFQFLHSGPMSLFFGAFALYILGSALEAEWGTTEYTVFWLVATLGGSLSAWALGTPLVSDPFVVPISMLFAYAFLFPDTQFLVFFVIPVKVKWIALFSAGVLGLAFFRDLFSFGAGPAFVRILGAGAGFLYFWVRHHGRFKASKAAREAVVAVKTAGAVRQDGVLEKRNRDLFPRVEALRTSERTGAEPPGAEGLRNELTRLVVPGVNICKPIDFKGDKDGICLKCEGFAECSLRYLAGQPREIVVRKREQ
jgi:membrane associated rhomboid family serine protease